MASTMNLNIGHIIDVILYILTSLGYMKLFEKCGISKRWAWIPLTKEYHLALCADREEEGKVYVGIRAFLYLHSIFTAIPHNFNNYILSIAVSVFGILAFAMNITELVYLTRIYTGLVKLFGKSRKWVPVLVLFEAIAVLYWGFNSDYKPTKRAADVSEIAAAKVFGTDIESIQEGLTVNIKERTAIDFFRKKVLLKDIHMCIPKGHMVLLLGGSGAGKTTYLNAITGYEPADAHILLGNNDVYLDYAEMMYDIGFVPQQDLMRGNDTVWLTLYDAATLRLPSSVSLGERNKRINAVLEQFGLTAVKDSLVEKLSGGQRKRLSIAMEFISDPTLFILDEPDSGLDGVVARNLFEKLRSIADEGKIVVVITHTPDRVIDLFDDVIVLAKDANKTGRLAWYGPVKDAYEFFGKTSMEEILLSINQKDEGGEGRADEFVSKYADRIGKMVG
ncbi:ATP-binding cassette domain-containing protein [Butyrivibrio sp. VCD2006]|uniref:ATP-binding cassette domain-containing protein n=1 Tax=Butyrivibrio sp. VCD2006 TaxID=1280664 RepID=UPI000412EBBA|nr:ABC transporter ATP-binding protein [Butyrivibrio sp. VCD2006]